MYEWHTTILRLFKGITTHSAFRYVHSHQAKTVKLNKRIRNSTLYSLPVDFFEYAYFAALSGCLVVTSDRTHIGIRRAVSLHSEHVYKDKFWVERSVNINHCDIPVFYKHWSAQGKYINLKTPFKSHFIETLTPYVSEACLIFEIIAAAVT